MLSQWSSHGVRWGLLLIVALVLELAFPRPSVVSVPTWSEGASADRTVISPVSYVVRKADAEIAREGQARAVEARSVYRFEQPVVDSAVVALRRFLSLLDAAAPSGPAVVARAGETRSVRLSPDEAEWLARSPRRRAIADSLTSFMLAMLSTGIADAGQVRAEQSEEITVIREGRERFVPRKAVLTFSDFVERSDRAAVPEGDALGQRVFRRIAASFFRPTLVYDADLTASRRGQLRINVDSLRYRVRAGEQIVASGEPVTAEVRDKLLELREVMRRRAPTEILGVAAAGGWFMNVLLLLPIWLLFRVYRRQSWASLREMLFLTVLLSLTILVARGLTIAFPDRPELLPISFVALTMAMLYNGRIALVTALALAVAIGQQWLISATPALFFGVVGATAGAMSVRAIRRRSRLYVTISLMVLAYALASLAMALVRTWTMDEFFVSLLAGYVSSVASVSIAMLLLPLAELGTRLTTDLTLLELADPSRPLLRRLAVEAPGTWAHSLSMANLCEAACTAIGANGLLARVGCYYHDVGKLSQPQLFVENQGRMGNPHDQMPPSQSAAVIRSHVTEGMLLARAARLPDRVSAFIPEHHGTSEIRYFLHRESLRVDPGLIDTEAFRYPGPPPRSRETAVVMLADSVEAVVRTLQKPSPESVQQAINDMVTQRIASGQLDDAPLTLRDLETVRREFGRVLSGQFHSRIVYPEDMATGRGAERPAEDVVARG